MIIIIIFSVFETTLYPPSIFNEEQYNPALHLVGNNLIAGAGTKFGLAELRTYTLFCKIKDFRFSGHSMGYELYRENSFYLGYRFPLKKTWTVGFYAGVLNNWVYETHNRFTYALRLGSVYQIRNMSFSSWINNLNMPKFTAIDYLPISYSIRCDYFAGTTFTFTCAMRGHGQNEPFFNIGFIVMPYQMVMLGMGVNTDPIFLEYVLKLKVGKLSVNYLGSNHHHLGLSHAFYIGLSP